MIDKSHIGTMTGVKLRVNLVSCGSSQTITLLLCRTDVLADLYSDCQYRFLFYLEEEYKKGRLPAE